MRILVIEDEARMLHLLNKGLTEHGHEVTLAADGAEGLKVTLDREFDVVLLDVGLPRLNGFDVAQVLRERKCAASIMMLTAYNKEDDIVCGLNLGADDYLTKPFSFPELLARLRAVTRPAPEPIALTFTIGDLLVDRVQHKVMRGGRPIDLTRNEHLLLEFLAQESPRVVSRSTLIEGIWKEHKEVTAGALDVLVNALRGKIDAHFSSGLLHTVRGSGYALRAEQQEVGTGPLTPLTQMRGQAI
ncbi:DNA-binding response OmpR family regulator [Silvibacterium bohemicum]|uniref:DNA-binding response OmpR family regulator n=1 Tax=Silvibacterium bohemicum TaxID=1577686 RepID=A0A841JTT8_9BACT|nr:response regulator transcription factor [Silvibacterium bohemicum]MBB6143149.1 DNA-binding response OmpR family regulator [Silvibacterium bohemicum]